jgi:glutathione peroxidase
MLSILPELMILAAVSLLVFAAPGDGAGPAEETKATAPTESLYDLTAKDIDGKEVKLSKYKGGVLLIVNVASK